MTKYCLRKDTQAALTPCKSRSREINLAIEDKTTRCRYFATTAPCSQRQNYNSRWRMTRRCFACVALNIINLSHKHKKLLIPKSIYKLHSFKKYTFRTALPFWLSPCIQQCNFESAWEYAVQPNTLCGLGIIHPEVIQKNAWSGYLMANNLWLESFQNFALPYKTYELTLCLDTL